MVALRFNYTDGLNFTIAKWTGPMYHYDPNTALEELTEDATSAELRCMCATLRLLGASGCRRISHWKLNRLFVAGIRSFFKRGRRSWGKRY